MASGRIDVRRTEVFYQSNRESFYSKNGYHDLGFNRDYDCDVNRRDNRGKSRYSDTVSRFEDEEPTAKRTKFSPVGFVRKEIRVSSKNRVVKKRTPPSLPKLSEKVNNFIVDGFSKSSQSTIQVQAEKILSIEARLVASKSDVLAASPSQNSELSQKLEFCGKNNVEEDCEFQPISKSRWAYEEYSPSEKSSSYKGSISPRENVEVDTPESGEICERGSSGSSGGGEPCNDEVDSHDYMDSCLDSEVVDDDFAPKPRHVDMLQSCRSVCEYERLGKISEGTYGIVYKARDKKTGEIVALKKVKMGKEREGFPLTALREINLLLALHHPSIVDVKEVVMDSIDDVYTVMEYMEYDLKKLIEVTKQPFTEREVKCLMLQLLQGIKDCHDNWILHRDLKTSNILISKSGKLKICDFGMSRQYGDPLKAFTTLVVTLWYRAPELLLGAKKYSTAVDMWSVGCIMGELLAKKPLFDGDNEVRQLDKIFRTLGTPTEAAWPGLSRLPGAKASFAKQTINTLRAKFPAFSFNGSPVLSERGFDLLSKLLTFDPEKRITVDNALNHDWFSVESKQELVSAQETLAMKIKTLTIRGLRNTLLLLLKPENTELYNMFATHVKTQPVGEEKLWSLKRRKGVKTIKTPMELVHQPRGSLKNVTC